MKTLNIEWKHLEAGGKTCDRCGDTGQALKQVVKRLTSCCPGPGLKVSLKETRLGRRRLRESNEILFNGRPLEELLPNTNVGQSDCPSCGELTGEEASCR